jgi:hypothetical protein
VQYDPRSGQPKTQRTDANVDRVRTLVPSDRRLGVRVIAEEGVKEIWSGRAAVTVIPRGDYGGP